MDELHIRIAEAIKRSGLTHQALGDRLGVSRAAVSQWIASDPEKRTSPENYRLPDLARALQVDLEWLLTGRGDYRPRVPLSPADVELLDNVRRLPQQQRSALTHFIDTLLPFEQDAQLG